MRETVCAFMQILYKTLCPPLLVNFIMQSSSPPQRLLHCQGQLHLLIIRTLVISHINTKQRS